ncbi:hypothetical protein [Mesorhizobium sp. A623]
MTPRPARRNTHRIVACLFALCWATAAHAGSEDGFQATSSVERHWTSNALDSDLAIADWYTLMRGSLERQWGGDQANVTLGAEFQATRHDTVSIEDDRALALSVQAFRQLRPGLELRGSLSYRVFDEGDDLAIGPLVLGTNTLKHIVEATGQIGVDLGNATTLVIEAADSFEKIGSTRFQDDWLLPAKLDPDLNRARLGIRLTRSLGRLSIGASGDALVVSVEELGSPPVALSLSTYALRGELTFSAEDGSTFGFSAGGELLRGANGIYSRLRPTWQAGFTKKLPHGLELRGTYFGRYETVNSDDPLASWLRRGQLEIGAQIRENLALAAGVFKEAKENLLFENVERKRGLYAELTCDISPFTAIILRLDYSKTFKTAIDERQSTIDAFIGLRAKI